MYPDEKEHRNPHLIKDSLWVAIRERAGLQQRSVVRLPPPSPGVTLLMLCVVKPHRHLREICAYGLAFLQLAIDLSGETEETPLHQVRQLLHDCVPKNL